MFYPGLIELTCEKCKQWVWRYKPEGSNDQKITHVELVYTKKNGQTTKDPIKKDPSIPTPCDRCPKKDPVQGSQIEKQLPRAGQVLDFYYQMQATHGHGMPELDPLAIRNLALVERLMEGKRQAALSESVYALLSVSATKAKV